jgi:hypothetical protein
LLLLLLFGLGGFVIRIAVRILFVVALALDFGDYFRLSRCSKKSSSEWKR